MRLFYGYNVKIWIYSILLKWFLRVLEKGLKRFIFGVRINRYVGVF